MIPSPSPTELYSRLSILYSNRALCHRSLENWNDVETDSLLAIQYDKYNAKAHYMIGLCLCKKEDWLNGIRSLEKAVDTAKRQKRPLSLIKEFEGAIAAGRYAWHAASIKDEQLIDNEFLSYLNNCLQYIKILAIQDIQNNLYKQSTNPLLMLLNDTASNENITTSINNNNNTMSVSPPSTEPSISITEPLASISLTTESTPKTDTIPSSRPSTARGLLRPGSAIGMSRPGTASTVSRYSAVVSPVSEDDETNKPNHSIPDTLITSSSSNPIDTIKDTLEQHYLSRISSISELFAERETQRTKRKIPEYFLCPITFELMLDPVITPGGHSYERLPLEHYIKNVKKEDPQTRQVLTIDKLIPNLGLKSAIQQFLIENPWAHPQLPRDPLTGEVSVTGIGPSTAGNTTNNTGNNTSGTT